MINQKLEEQIQSDPRVGLQVQLELLHNKNQLISRIRREFDESPLNGGPDFYAYMESNGIPPKFGFDFLIQMALHKRANISTMVGILRHHVDPSTPPIVDLQSISDMIYKCCQLDLCDYNDMTSTLIVKFDITQDVQDELDKYQYPLPMVVEPRKLNRNTDSAFLSTSDGGGSVILRDNHHDNDVCLDHLNRMNKVKFTINADTAFMIKNKWRNLDKKKPGETTQDFEKRVKAFEKYDKNTMKVVSLIVSDYQETKGQNLFYISHKYDKRGRSYCQGYHVNYQGAPWNKAVIELADKEVITNGS